MNRIAPIGIGILSVAIAGSLLAQGSRSEGSRLIAPDERLWFKRQSPAVRKNIMANLQAAKACISTYGKRDAGKDATTAAGLPRPRFYTGISNGVVIYRTVPGVRGCSPAFKSPNQDQLFRELPEAWSGPPRTMRIQISCEAAASKYAAAFNSTLARMKPDAFHAACPAGQTEVK
jgi:hypothetical protein